jgi:hypothetical protein
MLERLAFYRDLIVSECLPAVPGVPPGVAATCSPASPRR